MYNFATLHTVLHEVFPSPEMAAYLEKCFLKRRQIRDAIAYAPVPLERKRDLFLALAEGKDTSFFRCQAGELEKAIRAMEPKPGEFFCLRSCYRNYPSGDLEEKGLEPYLTWERLFERIREFLGYLEADERELTWFDVEKWSPDGTGRLENDYGYAILDGEVCYFWRNAPSFRERIEFDTYQDINLPVPFRDGDIVTVDCRPYAPVSHAVILEVGDNRDCCCLQALYRKDDGIWDIGAVKHGHIFAGCCIPGFSPLYRMTTFHGQLPEDEHLLEQVGKYLNGDEERGSALWNYIFDHSERRKKQTVTEVQILSYIKRKQRVSAFKQKRRVSAAKNETGEK